MFFFFFVNDTLKRPKGLGCNHRYSIRPRRFSTLKDNKGHYIMRSYFTEKFSGSKSMAL